MLLSKGADVNIQDERGFTALHHVLHSCSFWYYDEGIAVLLLVHGASTQIADIRYQDALCYSAPLRRVKLLRWIDGKPDDQPLSHQRDCRLRHAIYVLTSRLLDNNGRPTSPGFHELGHFLGRLGRREESLVAYEQQFAAVSNHTGNSDVQTLTLDYLVRCYYCSRDSCSKIYVCVTWLIRPFCRYCWDTRKEWYKEFEYTSENDIDFIRVPRPTFSGRDREFVNDIDETVIAWLKRIRDEYGINPLAEASV
ncbi:hypothetical protein GGR53DRAFT_143467 [Hypoxylon sp. FL1150]|nr:hypothetical protein GGR53DRAFT_143467 [Hypoxylon sp. FL1150]